MEITPSTSTLVVTSGTLLPLTISTELAVFGVIALIVFGSFLLLVRKMTVKTVNVVVSTSDIDVLQRKVETLESALDSVFKTTINAKVSNCLETVISEQLVEIDHLTSQVATKSAQVDELTAEKADLTKKLDKKTCEEKVLKTVPFDMTSMFIRELATLLPVSEDEMVTIKTKKDEMMKSRVDGILYSKVNVGEVNEEHKQEMLSNSNHLGQLRMYQLGPVTAGKLTLNGIRSNAHLMAKFKALEKFSVNKDDHYDLFYSYLATCKVDGHMRPCIVYLVSLYVNMYNEQQCD